MMVAVQTGSRWRRSGTDFGGIDLEDEELGLALVATEHDLWGAGGLAKRVMNPFLVVPTGV